MSRFGLGEKWAKSTNNEIIDSKFIALLNNPQV